MNRSIAIFLILLIGISSLFAQSDDQIVIGTKHAISSTVLEEDREYWVSLPLSYHEEASSYERYPILIVLDGSSHFQSITGMVNYMSAGYNGNRRIPEMIVVAVQNVNRRRDFTPDKVITRRENNTGGGDQFLRFLEEELIPQIDQDFRTTPYRMLFGHSLGGLLAAHTYMKETTLFNAFIAVDPSFGTWDEETMDKKLDSVTTQSFTRYLYVATANWDKRNIRNRDRHVRWYESLNSRCEGEFPATMEYFENENHGSVPVLAFHNGISSIFEGYGISYRDITSKAQLVEHFQKLSQRLSYTMAPPEALVNRVGYQLLRSKKAEDQSEALALFVLNTENYPESYNAFDSLGGAYEALGDNKNAIKHYQKSLELNPNNANASRKIASLEEGG